MCFHLISGVQVGPKLFIQLIPTALFGLWADRIHFHYTMTMVVALLDVTDRNRLLANPPFGIYKWRRRCLEENTKSYRNLHRSSFRLMPDPSVLFIFFFRYASQTIPPPVLFPPLDSSWTKVRGKKRGKKKNSLNYFHM